MIKVLFISQWYPNRYDPMAGLFVQKHAEALSLYADVVTMYIHPDTQISVEEIHKTNEKGFTEIFVYFPAGGNSRYSKIIKQFHYLKAYLHGFQLLGKTWGKPDIIQANIFTRTALIAYVFKLIHGTPYTVIEHWTRYFRKITFSNYFHKIISEFVARQASAIMPVTLHLQKSMEFHKMKNKDYHVINNVVDDLFFETIAQPVKGKIRILNVTCFNDDQKNLSGLLRVISKLYDKRQDFEIYLVGDGVDFKAIKLYASELGIENKAVFFTGMLVNEDLVRAYQQSHFSVLFSNYENIPVVISESFACGLPVISTNVGGIAEHINDLNGILINQNDEQALYDSLDFMIDHYSDYNKNDLIMAAKEKYGYQSVGKRFLSIYKSILKQ